MGPVWPRHHWQQGPDADAKEGEAGTIVTPCQERAMAAILLQETRPSLQNGARRLPALHGQGDRSPQQHRQVLFAYSLPVSMEVLVDLST